MKKKITISKVKDLLDKKDFHLHHADKGQVMRMTDIAEGLSVHEYSPARIIRGLPAPTTKRLYKVNAYQGAHERVRWKTSGFVLLTEAVQFANDNAEQASFNWKHDEESNSQ